ncbi:MAG TPA: O-antigen ligase family protein [Magnetospirillaceae bacterium]|nr:O-antigen ligase family protein [Magnetospirillaceae bacterium]
MARARIDTILVQSVTGVFLIILGLLPFHAFLSTWGGSAIGPLLVWKSWKEIVIALLVPLVVWLCVRRPDITRAIWGRWYNKLIALYAVLTIVFTICSTALGEASIAGLLMNLRFFALFVVAQVIVASGASWIETFKKRLTVWITITGVILAVLAILQVTLVPKDFLAGFGYNKDTTISPYLLVDENPDALRAFATMRGPNTLAAYLVLPLAVALLLWAQRKTWWTAGATVLMVVALFLTHSRSGWLGALAMAATLAFTTLPRDKLRTWIKFGTIPAVVAGVLVLWLATTIPAVRLAIFHSGGNDPSESLLEGSTDEHWQATWRGVLDIAAHPLGQGVGTAGPASFYNSVADIPENYYVQLGQEVGLLGVGLFLVISVLIAQALWQQKNLWPRALLASFVGITVINFFLHGWADDPTAMTWWGLAGLWVAAAAHSKNRKRV